MLRKLYLKNFSLICFVAFEKTINIEEGYHMTENKYKENCLTVPVERHETAAWANIDKIKPVSEVTIPSEVEVKNAKEYVDTNQK